MALGFFPPLVILTPAADSEADVQAPAAGVDGLLCSASGSVSGSQISGILALCQPLANQGADPTLTPEQVRADSSSVLVGSTSGSWSAVRIPRARYAATGQVQWNALVVCTYYYGFPPPTPTKEVVKFKGIQGTCSAMALMATSARRAQQQPAGRQQEQLERGEAEIPEFLRTFGGVEEVFPEFKLLRDLIRSRWEREVNNPQLLREPSERDGDWYLYRDLPVDIGHGAILGLNGRPLRATSISVAVERMSIHRDLGVPSIHVGTPLGTGESAVNQGGVIWHFPYYSTFGVVILQRETLISSKSVQQVIASSRTAPTDVFVDPRRPIHVAVNSPRLEDWMNVGYIDAWIRVNAR